MPENLPEEVTEGRLLLEDALKSQNHIERVRDFEDGIKLLKEYLEDNPDSSHKNVIHNIKVTYTKKLLEELPSLYSLDMDIWFHYFLLVLSIATEIEETIAEYPNLEKNEEIFFSLWKDELIKILK